MTDAEVETAGPRGRTSRKAGCSDGPATPPPLVDIRVDVPVTRRRVAVHRRLHPLRRGVPARLPGHRPRDRQGLHARRRVLVLRPVRRPLPHRRRHRQHALPAPLTDRDDAPMPASDRSCAAIAAVALTPRPDRLLGRRSEPTAATPSTSSSSATSPRPSTPSPPAPCCAAGYFEERAASDGDGTTYEVEWQDYDTGAPITAQMVAGKIDIGSMGDYPLLINGSARRQPATRRTELVSVTGYNPQRRAQQASSSRTDSDVADARPTSTGRRSPPASARPATARWSRRSSGPASTPTTDVDGRNQQPPVGASALEARHGRRASSQFVAWPGLLAFQRQGPAALRRRPSWTCRPSRRRGPRRRSPPSTRRSSTPSSRRSIDATDVPARAPARGRRDRRRGDRACRAEVVYLYNGRGGIATFDTTLKPDLVAALEHDVPFLKSIGVFADPSTSTPSSTTRCSSEAVRRRTTTRTSRRPTNPAAITGTDAVCDARSSDPATGRRGLGRRRGRAPGPSPTPTCLLRSVTRPRPTATRSGRRTSPTPRPAPAGSPTSRSGCATATSCCRSPPRQSADEHRAAHPGAERAHLRAGARGGAR